MRIDGLLGVIREAMTARTVYAEPYEKNGVTVIAAATVYGGGGGGTGLAKAAAGLSRPVTGPDQAGTDSTGGGFGLLARPTGAFVIKDGDVRWRPAVDVHRLVGTIGAIVVAGLLATRRRP
jgi:uncharacterized spore protein YtfJ